MANLAPPPEYWTERDQLTGRVTDRITSATRQWLLSVTGRLQGSPQVLKNVALTGQQAAIGATPIPLGIIAAGSYRITYYARIVVPGSISSSVTVTINWTDGGVVQSQSFAAMTGNLATTVQTDSIVVQADAGTNITYSVAYASNAAGMTYRLTVMAELLP
jgi:hypothetical protein